jgi:4-oxalocrotonate tautomerase
MMPYRNECPSPIITASHLSTGDQDMPLARIALRKGKPAAFRRALVDAVYGALRETFNVPEADLFMLVDEFEPENFHFDRGFMGFSRSDDLVIVQLTVANTRGLDQKRALYRLIAQKFEAEGLRPDDVFVNLVEVFRENWSFGGGNAQYV